MLTAKVLREWNERIEEMYLGISWELGAVGCIDASEEILTWAAEARERNRRIEIS